MRRFAAALLACAACTGDPSAPHLARGNVLVNNGKREEAAAEYREAARLNPKSSVARERLGDVLYDLGRKDEALAAYREASARDRAGFTPRIGAARAGFGPRFPSCPVGLRARRLAAARRGRPRLPDGPAARQSPTASIDTTRPALRILLPSRPLILPGQGSVCHLPPRSL